MNIEEMNYDQKINWACGVILMEIGRGNWRGGVHTVVSAVSNEAYQRGRKDGAADAKKNRKAKK